MEFSKRIATDDAWPKALLDSASEYKGKTLYDVLYINGQVSQYALKDRDQNHRPFGNLS